MKVYKDKQFLVFDFEDGKTVKYDFATKTAIGLSGKSVKNLQSQLRGITLKQIYDSCTDKRYADFLSFIERKSTCYNIGSLLSKVPSYAPYEQLFSAGLKIDSYFNKRINDIPKSLIQLVKQYDITLTNNMVDFYKKNPNAFIQPFNMDFLSLNIQDIVEIWKSTTYIYHFGTKSLLLYLLEEYHYNAKSLWLYLDRLKTFEALNIDSYLLREINDYANMMSQISNKFEHYPRNFLTTHKIAVRNYERLKKDFSEELFKKRITPEYECKFDDYQFIYPKSTQEIKDEATQQSNCVASYIDNVINGNCHILFLRKVDTPDKSLVTIEVRGNKIVQARRHFNELVSEEEQEVIDKWNKKFANKADKRKEDVA